MEQEHLKDVIESILFIANKPLRAKELAKFLEVDEALVQSALIELAGAKKESGIVVLDNNGEYQMATNAKYSTQVKNFLNMELREKLTDATVEVLAIIAYRQPISKAEIEAIRGVNSQYSIRHLLMRGLVERIPNPHDARSFLYQTATEFLQHLGLTSVKDLPEFEKLIEQVKLPATPQADQAIDDTNLVPGEPAEAPAVAIAEPELPPAPETPLLENRPPLEELSPAAPLDLLPVQPSEPILPSAPEPHTAPPVPATEPEIPLVPTPPHSEGQEPPAELPPADPIPKI